MSDRETVIKELTELHDKAYENWVHSQYNPFLTEVGKVCEDALSLLKDQEPQLVVKKWHKNPLGDYTRNHCPKCDNEIEKPTFISKDTSYCPYCGQAVKWE